ncbi:MAG: hypothetical protein IM537_11725 [Pseudanabaena sp. M57BS1SP1A06MG]|nr:hypothetical protein [Pseudanabaena sp. M53BS1SP1A06MG]MCA6593837.1 hypothetical protein [Pseudanabaena sp. M38BS1SP1A06MG]MCA6600851.1 hypothetical protein [Pseudanabaena sp. M57BS1SP1A06MG]
MKQIAITAITTMTKYSQFPSDEELETLLEEEPVYSVYWDSESIGAGADLEQVYRWGDKYIVSLSSDENITVYSSLLEAIERNDLFNVGDATKKIDSSELSSEEIAIHLKTLEQNPYKLLINSELWQYQKTGKFSKL